MLINMKELLSVAKEHSFAVPAFNISSLEILKAVIEKAEEMNAPVILEFHPDELSFLGDAFIETVKHLAYGSKIPVVIHLDHSSTFNQVLRAVKCGFTSVMIDASKLTYQENVAITMKVKEIAAPLNVSVEAELGTIGITGNSIEGGVSDIIFTVPSEAAMFVKETKIDTLAVAIGTAHGLYPKEYKPKLRIDILKEIERIVDIPLVLHGGSGNPDSEISEAVRHGICKVNISSDVKSAFFSKVRDVLSSDKNIYEPNTIFPPCIEEAKKVVEHKLKLLNTVDKVSLYK